MRQLNFDLLRLLEGDRQGSHGTRRMRRYVQMHAAETLRGPGYRGMRARADRGETRAGHGRQPGVSRVVPTCARGGRRVRSRKCPGVPAGG